MYYPPHTRKPSHQFHPDKSRSRSYIPPLHSRHNSQAELHDCPCQTCSYCITKLSNGRYSQSPKKIPVRHYPSDMRSTTHDSFKQFDISKREDSPEPYYLDKFGNLVPSGRQVYDNLPAAGARNSKSPSGHDERAGVPPALLKRNLHSSLSNILAYEDPVPNNSVQTSLNNTHRNRKDFGSPPRHWPAGRPSGHSTERYAEPTGPKSGSENSYYGLKSKWEKVSRYGESRDVSARRLESSPERRRNQENWDMEEEQPDSLEDFEDRRRRSRKNNKRSSPEKQGSPIKQKIDQEKIMTKDKQASAFQGRIKKASELLKGGRTYGEIHKGRRPSGPASPTKQQTPKEPMISQRSKKTSSSKSISQRSEEPEGGQGGFSHRLLTKEMLKSSKIEFTDETEDTVENFVIGYEPKRKPKIPPSMSRKTSQATVVQPVIEERQVTRGGVGVEISTRSSHRDDIDSLNHRIEKIKREIIEDITRKTQESLSSNSSDRVKSKPQSRTEVDSEQQPSRGLRRDSLPEEKYQGFSPIQELSKRYGEPTGVPRPRPETKIAAGCKEMENVRASPVPFLIFEQPKENNTPRVNAWNDESRRTTEEAIRERTEENVPDSFIEGGSLSARRERTHGTDFPMLIEDSRWPTNYSMGIKDTLGNDTTVNNNNDNNTKSLEEHDFSFEKSQQKQEKSFEYSREKQEKSLEYSRESSSFNQENIVSSGMLLNQNLNQNLSHMNKINLVKQQAPNFHQIDSIFNKASSQLGQSQQQNNISYDSKAYSSPTKNRPFMGFIKSPPKYKPHQGSPSKSIDYFFKAYNQQSKDVPTETKEISIPYSFGGVQPNQMGSQNNSHQKLSASELRMSVSQGKYESQEYCSGSGSRKINLYEVKVVYNDDKKDLMLMNFLNGNLLSSQLQESPNKKMKRRVF